MRIDRYTAWQTRRQMPAAQAASNSSAAFPATRKSPRRLLCSWPAVR